MAHYTIKFKRTIVSQGISIVNIFPFSFIIYNAIYLELYFLLKTQEKNKPKCLYFQHFLYSKLRVVYLYFQNGKKTALMPLKGNKYVCSYLDYIKKVMFQSKHICDLSMFVTELQGVYIVLIYNHVNCFQFCLFFLKSVLKVQPM